MDNRRGFFRKILGAIAGVTAAKALPVPAIAEETGMSMRMLRSYNPLDNTFMTRMDVLYGMSCRSEWTIRFMDDDLDMYPKIGQTINLRTPPKFITPQVYPIDIKWE